MPRNKISNKDLVIASRNGRTIHQVAEEYGFRSDAELTSFIKSFGNGKELIKAFNKNQKAFDKEAAIQKKNANDENVTSIQENVNPDETNDTDKFEITDNTQVMSQDTEIPMAAANTLAQLRNDEAELSALCISYENEHKELVKERRSIHDSLITMRRELEGLLKQMEVHQSNFDKLSAKHAKVSNNMLEKCREISSVKEMLDEIRKEILEALKISILFYGTSFEIEGEEVHIPEVDNDLVSRNFSDLLSFNEAENLTLKELKKMAELIALASAMESEGTKFDIVFDSSNSQALYEAFRSRTKES